MSVVHWQEQLEAAARAFSANATDETRDGLRTAAYGVWHWDRELRKAQKRDARPRGGS